ncbi:MAG: dihydrolipoamide acetyltransferase family protein [Desulfatiglandaceae bacterium]
MAIEIQVPKLGLTMTEATLVKWMFEAGDPVRKEEIVLVLETDKVTYEMPSPGDGLLHPLVDAGEQIEVSQVVGYLAADEAELAELAAKKPAAAAAGAGAGEKKAAPPPSPTSQTATQTPHAAEATTGGRIKASPLARAIAKEHGLDLSRLSGSGPAGRIIRADIVKALESRVPEAAPAMAAGDADLPLVPAREIPLAGVRRVIFKNMHLSLQTQAQITLHTEASASGLMDLRARLNRADSASKISYNAILIKAVAQALKAHPYMNTSVEDKTIRIWRQIHVGLAIDLGDGLMVPKLRRPDRKGIREISNQLDGLMKKAKEKKLLPDDLQGGTFTITNLGAWDIDHFTPIVNAPESAILGVGRILEKPVVREGAVVAEPRLSLSLTHDHRIIDGAPAAAFLKALKDMIENPILMLE